MDITTLNNNNCFPYRFCSAIGSGGIMPSGVTYTYESATRGARGRLLAALPAWLSAGAALAAGLSAAVLPPTGADALRDSRDHFSAWHRSVSRT